MSKNFKILFFTALIGEFFGNFVQFVPHSILSSPLYAKSLMSAVEQANIFKEMAQDQMAAFFQRNRQLNQNLIQDREAFLARYLFDATVEAIRLGRMQLPDRFEFLLGAEKREAIRQLFEERLSLVETQHGQLPRTLQLADPHFAWQLQLIFSQIHSRVAGEVWPETRETILRAQRKFLSSIAVGLSRPQDFSRLLKDLQKEMNSTEENELLSNPFVKLRKLELFRENENPPNFIWFDFLGSEPAGWPTAEQIPYSEILSHTEIERHLSILQRQGSGRTAIEKEIHNLLEKLLLYAPSFYQSRLIPHLIDEAPATWPEFESSIRKAYPPSLYPDLNSQVLREIFFASLDYLRLRSQASWRVFQDAKKRKPAIWSKKRWLKSIRWKFLNVPLQERSTREFAEMREIIWGRKNEASLHEPQSNQRSSLANQRMDTIPELQSQSSQPEAPMKLTPLLSLENQLKELFSKELERNETLNTNLTLIDPLAFLTNSLIDLFVVEVAQGHFDQIPQLKSQLSRPLDRKSAAKAFYYLLQREQITDTAILYHLKTLMEVFQTATGSDPKKRVLVADIHAAVLAGLASGLIVDEESAANFLSEILQDGGAYEKLKEFKVPLFKEAELTEFWNDLYYVYDGPTTNLEVDPAIIGSSAFNQARRDFILRLSLGRPKSELSRIIFSLKYPHGPNASQSEFGTREMQKYLIQVLRWPEHLSEDQRNSLVQILVEETPSNYFEFQKAIRKLRQKNIQMNASQAQGLLKESIQLLRYKKTEFSLEPIENCIEKIRALKK